MKALFSSKISTRALAVLLTAAFLPSARVEAARWQGPPPGTGTGPGAEPKEAGRHAEEIEETLEIYMIAKMKRALSLSHDQELKIVPLIQDLTESRRGYRRERRLDMMRLRPLVEDPASSEEEIRRVLSRMDEGERTFRSREARTLDQVRAALTPRQQGQFIYFQERFRKEMQERLRQFREEGPAGRTPRGPRRPGPPSLQDDE